MVARSQAALVGTLNGMNRPAISNEKPGAAKERFHGEQTIVFVRLGRTGGPGATPSEDCTKTSPGPR